MRTALFTLCLALFAPCFAQDQYKAIFSTDPYHSNGYFLVDSAKWAQLGVDQINVSIILAQLDANGNTQENTIQSFVIQNGWYGKADMGFLDTLQAGQFAFYRAQAFGQNGNVVLDYEGLPPGPVGGPWPIVCIQGCDAANYAWALRLYSDGSQAYIELWDAFQDDSHLFFYVPMADWITFKNLHPATSLGFSLGWDDMSFLAQDGNYQDEFVRFNGGADPLPEQAHDFDGYFIPVEDLPGGGYAIAKHRGPWAGIDVATNNMESGTDPCSMDLQDVFNADGNVQFHFSQMNLPPLACQGMAVNTDGGWGGSDDVFCTEISTLEQENNQGDLEVIGWVESVTLCHYDDYMHLQPNNELTLVSSIEIDGVYPTHRTPMFNLHVPDETDPKLVAVPRTSLPAGLYEYLITMDDGTILHHYEDYDQPVTISADFADFTDINIYPVPVKDRFAVAFDLVAPMDITMTVVDNMGTTYYQKALHFTQAGRNKEVVHMSTQWPAGLYHAIFQYTDGSSESKNFTVAP